MPESRSFFARLYAGIIYAGTLIQPFLLLLVRILWGVMFFEAGYGKLMHLDNTIQFFRDLHIPLPALNAYFVAWVEMVGGILLLVGFGARLASIPLIATLVVAYLTAHYDSIENFFSDPFGFTREMPFNFLLAALMVFAFGPGAFSIDAVLKKWHRKRHTPTE